MLNTLAICLRRSKASEEFIKRNYSKKERGEEARDIRDVAVNKLDGYPILEEKTSKRQKNTIRLILGNTMKVLSRTW